MTDLPKSLWIAEAGRTVIAPPIVFGDTLLLATQPADQKGRLTSLQAFDLADGTRRWEHDFEYATVSGMQGYYLAPRDQDIVVVTTSSSDFLRGKGSVLALDQEGQVIWEATLREDRFSAPVVMDRKIYVLAGSNNLLIVSPEQEGDNETRIVLDVNVAAAAPAIVDAVAYIPCRQPELVAVELSGNILWHFRYQAKARDWLDSTPAVLRHRLYAASSAGSLFALDKDRGEIVWQISTGEDRVLSPPVADNDRLYVGFRRGLLALEVNNGRVLWRFKTERPVTARPLIAHDTLYITSYDHNLYALDKTTGDVRWQYSMDRRIETPPVMGTSALVVVDRGGLIAAFERQPEPDFEEERISDSEVLRAAAEKYEQQGESLRAAEVWCQLGKLERAAELYEVGADWQQAAETWQKLFRYNRRAEAYEKYARLISEQDVDDEVKAGAWEQAAHAYRETTLREARIQAEIEIARYRQQPILEIDVGYDDLEVDTWSTIRYTVSNKGFGPARLISVLVEPGRFETESDMSLVQPVLRRESPPYIRTMQVRPLQKGEGVPMKFIVEYRDMRNQDHRFDRTFNIPVVDEDDVTDDLASDSFDDLVAFSEEERRRSLELARALSNRFSMEELEDFLFVLGINPDNLEGSTLAAKARELVKYYLRRQKILELVEAGRTLRQDIDWDQFL